jgi:hypothetical protein
MLLSNAGLPDGFYSDQNSGYIFEVLGIENVVAYSGHLK